jgi:hypothetical protein
MWRVARFSIVLAVAGFATSQAASDEAAYLVNLDGGRVRLASDLKLREITKFAGKVFKTTWTIRRDGEWDMVRSEIEEGKGETFDQARKAGTLTQEQLVELGRRLAKTDPLSLPAWIVPWPTAKVDGHEYRLIFGKTETRLINVEPRHGRPAGANIRSRLRGLATEPALLAGRLADVASWVCDEGPLAHTSFRAFVVQKPTVLRHRPAKPAAVVHENPAAGDRLPLKSPAEDEARRYLEGKVMADAPDITLAHHSSRSLSLPTTARAGEPGRSIKFSIHEFQPSYQGIPIARSGRAVISRGDGTILFLRAHNIPPTAGLATTPVVDLGAAQQRALGHAWADFAALYGPGAKARLTISTKEKAPQYWVDAGRRAHLVWSILIETQARPTPFARRYWIAARDRDPTFEYEDVHVFDHAGTVSAFVTNTDDSYSAPMLYKQRLPWMKVVSQVGGATMTDANGSYRFPYGAGPATITGQLTGPFCNVLSDDGMPFQVTLRGSDAAPIDLVFRTGAEYGIAQINAFRWVNFAHDFVAAFIPPDPVPLNVHVNVQFFGNAYYNDAAHALIFSSSSPPRIGNACTNASYPGPIFHEYGHYVDDLNGGIQDHGYSEGFGDALSLMITRDPLIGRDFFGVGNPWRDSSDVVTWTDAANAVDDHLRGQVYSGFVWALSRALKSQFQDDDLAFDRARTLVLAAAQWNPSSIPEAVRYSLLIDSLMGSPCRQALLDAATSRKIPVPVDPSNPASP